MSAWIVSDDHVNVLVQAAIDYGVSWRTTGDKRTAATLANASEVGAMLWRENHRSVNYLYGTRDRTPGYTYRVSGHVLTHGFVMGQVACYMYQSCERPDWERSQAYRLCVALTGYLARQLPGCKEAPWGV